MYAGRLQEKKGYFYIVISYKNGAGKRKEKWISTGLTIKGNKKRAQAMLSEAQKTFVPPVENVEEPMTSRMLFSDFLLKWLKIVKPTVKLITYSSYDNTVKNLINPYFKKRYISLEELRATDIQEFYAEQLERVKPNSVIRYHAIIHRALKYAVKVELIDKNPADNIERPRKNEFVGSFYDSNEMNALFQAIKCSRFELPIMLAAFYGLRRGEVLGLRWSAIDFNENTLRIQHTVTGCNLEGKHIEIASDTAKTKSSMRTLPLVPDIRRLLLTAKESQDCNRLLCGKSYCTEYLDYVFVNEIGERMKPNYLSNGFRKILANNHLRKIRFHDLRHSCASLLLANGVYMKQIQEWLGHSDFSTTANIYAHLDYKSKLSSADAMLAGLGMTAREETKEGKSEEEKKPA